MIDDLARSVKYSCDQCYRRGFARRDPGKAGDAFFDGKDFARPSLGLWADGKVSYFAAFF